MVDCTHIREAVESEFGDEAPAHGRIELVVLHGIVPDVPLVDVAGLGRVCWVTAVG